MNRFSFLILLLAFASSNLWSKATITEEVHPFMPEAKVIRGITTDGIDYTGLFLGEKENPAIIVTGGVGLNIVYLRWFSQLLADRGLSVYAINLNGYGRGQFASAVKTTKEKLGFAGSLSIIRDVIDYAYTRSENKVAILGHSSGGMLIRMASTGVKSMYQKKELPKVGAISENYKADYRKKVSLTIPMFSPLIHPHQSISKKQKKSLKKITRFLRLFRWSGKLFKMVRNARMKLIHKHLYNFMMKIGYKIFHDNELIMGTEDLNGDEFLLSIKEIISDDFPKQLLKDTKLWAKNFEMLHSNGFSYSKAWLDQQKSSEAVQTLLIFGEKDRFTNQPLIDGETQNAHKMDVLITPMGHAGSYYDLSYTEKLVEKIKSHYHSVNTTDSL
jgi:pimeloyl-ACP methyl ester carboxylesterase